MVLNIVVLLCLVVIVIVVLVMLVGMFVVFLMYCFVNFLFFLISELFFVYCFSKLYKLFCSLILFFDLFFVGVKVSVLRIGRYFCVNKVV